MICEFYSIKKVQNNHYQFLEKVIIPSGRRSTKKSGLGKEKLEQ
jgi:hypothetical protein